MASTMMAPGNVHSLPDNYFAFPASSPAQASGPQESGHSMATGTGDDGLKRHAACDECRKRKLKCSGEPSGCSRCVKHKLDCVFSPQKQMGRPKKRQKTSNDANELPIASNDNTRSSYIDPSLSAADTERNDFQNICPSAMARSIRDNTRPSSITLSNTPPSDNPATPTDRDLYNNYPTDYSLWPDFSSTVTPIPVQDKFGTIDIDADPNDLSTLPSPPKCPCLPNLYLTLSTLATLTAYPATPHTITTLISAHRTAHAVIYCNVCPTTYQSGSSNVMLSNTLLGVLVDQWHRFVKTPASELRKGFCSSLSDPSLSSSSTSTNDTTTTPPQMTAREDLEWRTFAYTLMRHHVFGAEDTPTITPQPCTKPFPTTCTTTSSLPDPSTHQPHNHPSLIHPLSSPTPQPSLFSIASSLSRRQHQWHALSPETGEFPRRMGHPASSHAHGGHNHSGGHSGLVGGSGQGFTLEDLNKYEAENNAMGREHLCVQLAGHALKCVRSLEMGAPVLGG